MIEKVYKKGSVLVFSSGEYSDYGYEGILVTIRDVDLVELGKGYSTTYEPKNKWDSCDASGFVAWLVANGYAMPVDYVEIHAGSYGEFRLDHERKRDGS